MAKTNFKEFQLKKDKTGSFVSIGNKQNKKNIVHKHANKKHEPTVRELVMQVITDVAGVKAELKNVIKLNNLKH